MDRVRKSVTYRYEDRTGMSTMKIALVERDHSLIRMVLGAKKSNYYIEYWDVIDGVEVPAENWTPTDVDNDPKDAFSKACFPFFKKQYFTENLNKVKEYVCGMSNLVFFSGGLRDNYLDYFDPDTTEFRLYMYCCDGKDFFANKFSEMFGIKLSGDDMRKIRLTITNNSVTLCERTRCENGKCEYNKLATLDNPSDFINTALFFGHVDRPIY